MSVPGSRMMSWVEQTCAVLTLFLVTGVPAIAAAQVGWLQQATDDFLSDNPAVPAVAVTLVRGGEVVASAASGLADPAENIPMTSATPVRIASVTKIYVAATLLNIAAQQDLDLRAPISQLLPEEYLQPMQDAGYQVDDIQLRHLLSHSGGLRQHDDSRWYTFRSFVLRWLQWTPLDTVSIMAGMGPPLAPPGERYAYSDTGYVLLGQVIEGLTDMPLHAAVRQTLDLDALGLQATWWESLEAPPDDAPAPAQQFYFGMPMNGIDASMDLYGGGGLMSSATDMALFMQALFDHRVLYSAALLAQMTGGEGAAPGSDYRYGIVRSEGESGAYFHHNGFWGTEVVYFPAFDTALAGVVTRREALGQLHRLLMTSAMRYGGAAAKPRP